MRLKRIAAPQAVAARVLGYTSSTSERRFERQKSAQNQKYEAKSVHEETREAEVNIKPIPIVHEKSFHSGSSQSDP